MQDEQNNQPEPLYPEPSTSQTEETTPPEPSQQPEIVTPLPVKKSKKPLVITLIVLLAAGGAAAYWFLLRNEPSTSLKNDNQNQTQDTEKIAVKKNSFYFTQYSYKNNAASYNNYLLNASTKAKTQIGTTTSEKLQLIAVVELEGKTRSFYFIDDSEKELTKHSIAYQDDAGKLTTIYSVTSKNDGSDVKRLAPGGLYGSSASISADGTNLDFLEITSNKLSIKRVDASGKVTELASNSATKNLWGISGYEYRTIIPSGRSKDDNTVYFSVLKCIECDGGSSSDILALDTKSGKFSLAYEQKNEKNNGNWVRLDEDTFVLTEYSQPVIGDYTYNNAVNDVTDIFAYNIKTKKTTTLFKSKGDAEHGAGVLGYSKDGKSAYISVSSIKKGKKIDSDYEVAQNIKEIRAYKLDASYEVVTTGLDYEKESVNFMFGLDESIVYGTEPGQTAFNENAGDKFMGKIYSQSGISTNPTELYSTESANDSLSFTAFSDK
jgi:hypothetical protein